MKATATAPANIAFIKYWGKKDERLRLPQNGSISMNLNKLLTSTTVEFSDNLKTDSVIIGDKNLPGETERVMNQIGRIRKIANLKYKVRVVSRNTFPIGTGLSTSASGFAALTLAAAAAAKLKLSEKELTVLARQGSGSACRSIPDGFVEWREGGSDKTSYAYSLYPEDYWDILDIVAIISRQRKDISSSEGQKSAHTSPFYDLRIANIKNKIALCKKYLSEKKFPELGALIEAEALELHAIMMTSVPSLIYWLPETVQMIRLIKKWRSEGIQVYFTLNTGQDVHLILQSKDRKIIEEKLNSIKAVKKVIVNQPSVGARLTDKHLF